MYQPLWFFLFTLLFFFHHDEHRSREFPQFQFYSICFFTYKCPFLHTRSIMPQEASPFLCHKHTALVRIVLRLVTGPVRLSEWYRSFLVFYPEPVFAHSTSSYPDNITKLCKLIWYAVIIHVDHNIDNATTFLTNGFVHLWSCVLLG